AHARKKNDSCHVAFEGDSLPLFAFLFYCPATAYPEGRELSTLANTAYLPAPCVYKKAPQSGAFPQFSKPSACSRSKQAHQTSGALEVECVKKRSSGTFLARLSRPAKASA